MKLKSFIALLTLSVAMWAQTNAPAPKKSPSGPKAAASDTAKDHTCADCCKDGKCEMKDGASCPMMKDGKAACMGANGCAGMNHEGMKHDDKNASAKPDMMADHKMGAHCPMMSKMAGKDGKKGCCGMCGGGKATGK